MECENNLVIKHKKDTPKNVKLRQVENFHPDNKYTHIFTQSPTHNHMIALNCMRNR